MTEYFFDSYAIIEIMKGNPRYLPYFEKGVTITWLNLVEITNSIFLDFGEDKADTAYKKFKECVKEVDWKTLLHALKLKQKHKKKNLSYADCIGYALAQVEGLRFLTGDEGFRDLENVEFVK